jgi:hypothetical protein
MKRTQQDTAKRSGKPGEARTIDAKHLTRVRGGNDLGVAIQVGRPISFEMRLQHNEALIAL